MLKENFKATGKLAIELRDVNGNVIDSREVNNVVVDPGLVYIASRMIGATANVMSHMAVGTSNANSTDPTASTQTALGAEGATARASLSSITTSNQNITGDSVTYVATFIAGVGTGALVEAGIFNASTAGTMLCRTTFPVINKGTSDSLTITWKVTVA